MSEIKLQSAYRVTIIESERGWGQRVDEVKYFSSEAAARGFCQQFNAQNTESVTPDWYMVAQYDGKVS